jgi:hypothetical protein
MQDSGAISEVSRRLRARGDAINGAAFLMTEAATGFTELGLGPGPSMLGSRAACLGPVPGPVAAAVLAPIEPTTAAAAVDEAFAAATPARLLEARRAAATRHLERVLDGRPPGVDRAVALLRPIMEAAPVAGHPMFAGLCSVPWPDDPLGQLWRACDMVRERRGDSHRNAWLAAGLDGAEINVLTDAWRGPRFNGTTSTWPADALTAAATRLRDRGLLAGDALTDAGRDLREEIELATDRQDAPVVERLGSDAPELFDLLTPWARAVVRGAG